MKLFTLIILAYENFDIRALKHGSGQRQAQQSAQCRNRRTSLYDDPDSDQAQPETSHAGQRPLPRHRKTGRRRPRSFQLCNRQDRNHIQRRLS